jgi:hypothetical protein
MQAKQLLQFRQRRHAQPREEIIDTMYRDAAPRHEAQQSNAEPTNGTNRSLSSSIDDPFEARHPLFALQTLDRSEPIVKRTRFSESIPW